MTSRFHQSDDTHIYDTFFYREFNCEVDVVHQFRRGVNPRVFARLMVRLYLGQYHVFFGLLVRFHSNLSNSNEWTTTRARTSCHIIDLMLNKAGNE